MSIKSNQQAPQERILTQIESIQSCFLTQNFRDMDVYVSLEELCDLIKVWGAEVKRNNEAERFEESVMLTVEKIRDFALFLYNKHDQLNFSIRVMNVLNAVFGNTGDLGERFCKDIKALETEKQKQLQIHASLQEESRKSKPKERRKMPVVGKRLKRTCIEKKSESPIYSRLSPNLQRSCTIGFHGR